MSARPQGPTYRTAGRDPFYYGPKLAVWRWDGHLSLTEDWVTVGADDTRDAVTRLLAGEVVALCGQADPQRWATSRRELWAHATRELLRTYNELDEKREQAGEALADMIEMEVER